MNQQTKAIALISTKCKVQVLTDDQSTRLKGGAFPWIDDE